ncbi:hypothetical protein ACHAXT_010517 [Thalassiosira profunda]
MKGAGRRRGGATVVQWNKLAKMAPTKSNRKAGAKPAPLRKSTRTKAGAKPPSNPNDKENRPADTNGRESLLQEAETDDVHEQNWWAINVEKAAALIEKCMKEYGWDRAETKRILASYRHFLILKKEHEDWDESKLFPCWPVFSMWEEHRGMDDYSTDMRDLLGHVLSFGRRIAVEERQRLIAATREALKERFGSYDAELWDDISIDVQNQLGDIDTGDVNRRTPLSNIMDAYCQELREVEDQYIKMSEEDIEKLQFVFNGKLIKRDDTCIRLGIEDGAEIRAIHPDKVAVTIRFSSGNKRLILADMTTMISKAFEECDLDFGEERSKNVFLYGQRRVYGFESPLALEMNVRGNVIDVVDIESHKSENCMCCNPGGAAGATGDSSDDH